MSKKGRPSLSWLWLVREPPNPKTNLRLIAAENLTQHIIGRHEMIDGNVAASRGCALQVYYVRPSPFSKSIAIARRASISRKYIRCLIAAREALCVYSLGKFPPGGHFPPLHMHGRWPPPPPTHTHTGTPTSVGEACSCCMNSSHSS